MRLLQDSADPRDGYRCAIEKEAAIHRGLYCPVCERQVSEFLPLPPALFEQLREHGALSLIERAETLNVEAYTCPHCGASDRDRLYALFLKEHFERFKNGTAGVFIDFAPSQPLSVLVRTWWLGVYRTADLFMNGVDDRVDIQDLSTYADESAEFFICSHVLEHVHDDRKALKELHRILKPTGRGILMVPILMGAAGVDEDLSVLPASERWRRFGQDDHLRVYSRSGFLERVRDAGFEVQLLGNDHFGTDLFALCGISSRSVLYTVMRQSR